MRDEKSPRNTAILPSLAQIEAFLIVGVAAGLVEGLNVVFSIETALPHWGGLLLESMLLFPALLIPQAFVGYCLLGGLARLPGLSFLGGPHFRLGFCLTAAALLLPLAVHQTQRRPGFSLTLFHLGPYLLIAISVLAASILCGWLFVRLHADGGRSIRRTARTAVLIAMVVCGAHYAFDRPRIMPPARAGEAADRPNIVLITVDTLRADHLGIYGYAKTTDPEIQRYFGKELVFSDAVSNIGLTRPSHAAILTGRYPTVLGLRWNTLAIPSATTTLAEVLSKNGYDTAAFISAWPLFSEPSGLGRGFHTYSDKFNLLVSTHYTADRLTPIRLLRQFRLISTIERTAKAVTDDVVVWLDEAPQEPYFLWVHYYDPHSYYEPPREFAHEMGLPKNGPANNRAVHSRVTSGYRSVRDEDVRNVMALYDGEIRYVDNQVGRLLDRIDARGQLDRTVVLLTADHGETIFEKVASEGWVFEHGKFLDEWEIRIPFLIRGPGVPTGVNASTTASGIDVMPTLLGAAGIDVPEGVMGRNLVERDGASSAPAVTVNSPEPDEPSRFTARADGYKYERQMDSREESLIRVDAPSETRRDLLAEAPDIAARLRSAVEALPDIRRQVKVGADEAERLRALGYVVDEE